MEFAGPLSIASGTIGANSREFDSVGQHFITAEIFGRFLDRRDRFHVDIIHSAARTAPNMIMVCRGRIETSLCPRDVYFQDQPFVG